MNKQLYLRKNKVELDSLTEHMPGWSLIVKNLVDKLFELGWDGKIEQIKEKFGGLRFYILSSDERWTQAIDEAEKLSCRTCEECGAAGANFSIGGGWLKTLCKPHAIEQGAKVDDMCPHRLLDVCDCEFCDGSACTACGAGLWEDWDRPKCTHDIMERHERV